MSEQDRRAVTENDSADLATRLVEHLRDRGLTIATAESLTAGLVSAGIADVPGASAVLRGGAATYATPTKAAVLGVDADLLRERGAVDADVALEMAHGAVRLFAADLAVATTGVAGPAIQDGQDVGTCYVAVAFSGESSGERGRCHVDRFQFVGDRAEIRRAAAWAAWQMALDHTR